MFLKIKNFFLAFILILLQSCTGGRIGNFLDSSFKNIDEQTIEKASKNIKKLGGIKPDNKNEAISRAKQGVVRADMEKAEKVKQWVSAIEKNQSCGTI